MREKLKIMWCIPAWRGLLEGWLFALLMLWATLPTLRTAPPLVISMLLLLNTGICAGWAGARIRLKPKLSRRVIFFEGLLSLGLTVGHYIEILGLMWIYTALDLLQHSHVGETATLLYMALSIPGFLATRGSGYFLRFWNRLRRKRFVWSLTHTLLSVIALTGSLAIFIGILYWAFQSGMDISQIPVSSVFSTLVIWAFTLFFVILAAGLIFLIVFTLPSFGLSYWMARRMTTRVERLTAATAQMRSGDLSVRVPVEGEDEMAALQTNFNAMADNLQSSTEAVQTERNTVAGLLKVQRELSAGVSHELRTPAASILAHSQALLQSSNGLISESINNDIKIIAHEADRLQTILTDLLTLAQGEAGRISLRLQKVDTGHLVCQAVQTLAPLAWEQKRIQVTTDIHPGLQPAWADSGRIEQILINLIQNGVRHTPPGGAVIASAWSEMDWTWLEVADTGEGIAETNLSHIWEAFYRAQNGDEKQSTKNGFGLGLAMVKELTEAMGGYVFAESIQGEGSIFRVRLPIAPII
ncbi:MAG: sensor histidine kinase [Anaerolineaceae bacterium]